MQINRMWGQIRKRPAATLTAMLTVEVLGLALLGALCCRNPTEETVVRVGWQVAWAVQAQIAQTLGHTNIPELNGLRVELKGFTYGAPLNEAAVAGDLDVGFLGEQPAISLIARDPRWRIVARLFYTRLGLIIPSGSTVGKVSDLKGKTVAIPFGSTAHRLGLGWLAEAGLGPGRDVHVVNLDIAEQAGVVLGGTAARWRGDIDALITWDPSMALFEYRGLAKVLKQDLGQAVVVMSEGLRANRDAAVRFLKAYIEAYYFYAQHQESADRWFAEAARTELDPSMMRVAASFEPNLKARSLAGIEVRLTAGHIESIRRGAEFGQSLGLSREVPDVREAVDESLLTEALEVLQQTPIDLGEVEVH